LARPRKPPEDLVAFGRVAGPYGVRGWLKVLADEPEVLAAQPAWWLEGAEHAVEETKAHSGTLPLLADLVKEGRLVAPFKGKAVSIPRPDPGEGRYYWSDLVGLEVVNEQGVVLGVVKAMSSNGAHDVMEVAGERPRLLPFVPAYVKKVDLRARRIDVEWGADW